MEYLVHLDRDPDAAVWIAASEDIPESGSVDALIERVRYAAPELLVLSRKEAGGSLHFCLDRRERLFAG